MSVVEFARTYPTMTEKKKVWDQLSPDMDIEVHHFPTNWKEYLEQQKRVGPVDLAFELAEIAQEMLETLSAESRYSWVTRKTMMREEKVDIPEEEKPTLIWNGGLGTWRGMVRGRGLDMPFSSFLQRGPYGSMVRRLENSGVHVIEIYPKSGINTPDKFDENVELTAKTIDYVSETSAGPIELGGHSMGVGEGLLLAARHPDQAKKVKHFFSGGFPLPVKVNPVVEGAFVFYRNGMDFRAPRDIIDFLNSKESGDFKAKTVCWLSENDRIVDGPSAFPYRRIPAAHSTIFYDDRVNNEIVDTSKADMAPKAA